MSTILQSVKKKIYAVCPEKMELSFGCQLLRHCKGDNHASIYYVLTHAGQGRPDGIVWISSIPFGSMTIDLSKDEIKNGGEFEILGHPLGLPEVLRAIAGNHNSDSIRVFLNINEVEFDDPLSKKTAKWNLLVNLDGQSEELIHFLDEIL